MRIKVNGLCRANDIDGVAQLGIDYVGLQFAKDKPHHMVMRLRRTGTLPDTASSDYSSLMANGASRLPLLVGMFSDASVQSIVTAVYSYSLDYVQLDSDCGDIFVRNLIATIVPDISERLGIIKAFDISSADDFESCHAYDDLAEAFIFRMSQSSEHKNSSDEMAEMAKAYHGKTPFLVNCSLCDAVAVAAAFDSHPSFIGLDLFVDDGVESVKQNLQNLSEIKQICG